MRVIVTGASGMVGEGVLLECLHNPVIEAVLVIGRRHCGIQHPKLKEILHPNFMDITPIQHELKGYNACYFCLGVSSIGMNEAEYTRLTHTLTMHVATVLSNQNLQMVFCYVSGKNTDINSKQMWARVKGQTEHDLRQLPFKAVYAFRPGFMKATKGQQNTLKLYPYFAWMYPILKLLFPGSASTLAEVAQAMIRVTTHGYSTHIIEVKDIIQLAHASS